MTEQNIPEDVREIVEKMRYHANHDNVRGREEEYIRYFADLIETLLPPPPRPTMADMTEEERAECQWMQCDAGPYGRRGLIVKVKYWSVYVVDKETGTYSDYTPDLVTARPDLPRFEWADTEKADDENAVKIGDEIESADDPRLAALPYGSILLDRDEEATTKRLLAWTGRGNRPIPSEGDEFGPWTVLHIPKEADQ